MIITVVKFDPSLDYLEQGKSIAYASEAGTLNCRPRFFTAVRGNKFGENVTSAPGPCALIAALTIGGLSTDKFYFEGFLPNNKIKGN